LEEDEADAMNVQAEEVEVIPISVLAVLTKGHCGDIGTTSRYDI
jgi:hypothetical protein